MTALLPLRKPWSTCCSTFLAFLLPAMTLCSSEQIDPVIYSRLFMNNRPLHDHMSREVLQNLPAPGEGGGRLGSVVLDLASGPGEPSVTLATLDNGAERISKIARILTTDSQPGMLEKAKGRAVAANVTEKLEFAVTAADDLSAWPDQNFDAVTMSFGLMFVPDKEKCLKEIRRVLRPGGFAYLSVWKKLPFQTFARAVLEETAGAGGISSGKNKSVPPFAINPLALEAENAVEKLAKSAKLVIVGSELLKYTFTMGSIKDTTDGLKILAGSLLKQLESEGQIDAGKKFNEIVAREVKARGWIDADGQVGIPGNMPQVLTLRRPLDEAGDLLDEL